jgi:hypothetical protein
MKLLFVIVNEAEKGFEGIAGSDGVIEIRGTSVSTVTIVPSKKIVAEIARSTSARILVFGSFPARSAVLRDFGNFFRIRWQ